MDHVSRLTQWLSTAAERAGVSGVGVPSPSGDWQLWREACAGRAASATRLVQALTPQAYGLAIQMVGRREDAQDVVQDAFLRLWRSRPSDTRGAKLSTYFNTIVINCCRSLATARREWPTEHDALTALHDAQQQRDEGVDEASGQADGAAHGLNARLQRGLQGLPARQRMALAMWTYADASAADIAQTLAIDPNAAHQLLHRAKQALRAHLEGGVS